MTHPLPVLVFCVESTGEKLRREVGRPHHLIEGPTYESRRTPGVSHGSEEPLVTGTENPLLFQLPRTGGKVGVRRGIRPSPGQPEGLRLDTPGGSSRRSPGIRSLDSDGGSGVESVSGTETGVEKGKGWTRVCKTRESTEETPRGEREGNRRLREGTNLQTCNRRMRPSELNQREGVLGRPRGYKDKTCLQ